MSFETMFNPTCFASRCQFLVTRPGHFRQRLVAKLAEYKAGLLEELNSESKAFLGFVRLGLTEAEALAWSTPYPHLFLPALVEEKIRYARQWTRRQCRIASDSIRSHGTKHEAMRWKRLVRSLGKPETYNYETQSEP